MYHSIVLKVAIVLWLCRLSTEQPTVGERMRCFDSHDECTSGQQCAYTFVLPRPNGQACPSTQNTVLDMTQMKNENMELKQTIGDIQQELLQVKSQLGNIIEGWELVFKAVSGAGDSVYNLWVGNNGGQNEDNAQARELNKDFPGHYKSASIDSWSSLGVKKVKVAIYEGGKEQMYMIFDGEGSDKMNWFSKQRLTHTSYTDLNSATTTNFFSIYGDGSLSRRFMVNRNYGGCTVDMGWLVVVDPGYVVCDWSSLESLPYFLYGKARQRINYQSGSEDVGYGDVFAVFIKT